MTGSPVADLHVHTNASDGTLSLREIPDAASNASLHTVALTDHDRFHPDLTDPVMTLDTIRIIRGIELKVSCPDGTHIDLLGYAAKRTRELAALIDRLQENRVERAEEIIRNVEKELDISLPITIDDGIGRPHIAGAVSDHPAVSLSHNEVFDELIGDGRPCYVPREIPSLSEGKRILRNACELVSVAHPLRYRHLTTAVSVATELGAIERWYPYKQSVDLNPIDRAIEQGSLIPTGGSDAHGRKLGQCGLDEHACQRVLSALKIV